VVISVWATLILVAISDHVTLLFLGFFFKKKQGVSHVVPLPFTLKHILRQKKKNYGNTKISPCKIIIFKKASKKKNQNPSR
jgi:hypothetical protein